MYVGKLRRTKTDDEGMTLVDHLAELRRRIIVIFVALFWDSRWVLFFKPLVEYLLVIPGQLVYLYPGEAFSFILK